MSKARAELIADDDRRGMRETLYLLALPGMRASIRRGLKTPLGACGEKLGGAREALEGASRYSVDW